MSDASSNASKRMLSIGLAAIIVLSSIVVVLPVEAQQQPQMTVSATRFHGGNLVQVIIREPAKPATITATVSVSGQTSGSTVVTVPPVSAGSDTYEFYITTHDTAVPNNPLNSGSPIVRIRSGGTINTTLTQNDKVTITYSTLPAQEITYAPTTATLVADRGEAGDENIIRLRMTDPDFNFDPTFADIIELSAGATNIVEPTADSIEYDTSDPVSKWIETGPNTGVFELRAQVKSGAASQLPDEGIQIHSQTFPSTLIIKIQDYERCDPTLAANNKIEKCGLASLTASQPAINVNLRNRDGAIDIAAPVTLANGLQMVIRDADRNIDTRVRDTINSPLTNTGVTFRESGDNTGEFLPDLANNRIPIVISNVTDPTFAGNQLRVSVSHIANDTDIQLIYNDPTMSSSVTRIVKIQHFVGNISTTTPSVPVTGKAIIEINDNDLNTDSTIVNGYTLTFNTDQSTLSRQVSIANGLANLVIKARGNLVNFTSAPLTIQLTEVDTNGQPAPNTGIFRGEVDIAKINDALPANQKLADGDRVTFEYKDNTESPTITRTVDVRIGKPSGTIELDRTSYPPSRDLNGDGDLADNDDAPTKIHVVITDPSFNTSSTSQDTLPISTGRDNDATTFDRGSLKIELRKGNITLTFKPNAALGFPTTASEDGVNTGKFTVDVNLPRNVNVDDDKNVIGVNVGANPHYVIDDGWQIRAVYKDDNGDEQTATASIVQNTAVITTDKPTYDLGSTIILQIREPDWNNDSDKVDEIPISITDLKVDSDKVTDKTLDEIAGLQGITLDPSKLRETGKNTGIFEIKIQNINANLVSRGKNLEFTYTDRTPSGGGLEQEVKLAVLIAPTQPDIILDKEVYTPFDRMCIQIVDPGANSDSDAKDKLFVGANQNARVRIIVGGTTETWSNTTPNGSRNIGTWEETAPDSGVFHFTGSTNCVLISDVAGTDNNGITNAKPGDGIRVEYRTADRQLELSKTARIAFNDGSIAFDKDSYRIGETARITIEDPDENRNPDVPDQFTVKVVSDTDPAGISVTVRETGDRTGKFTVDIILTSGVSSGNRLQVREGDQITAIYTDETLPGAQTIKQSLVNRNEQGLRTLQTRDVAATATIGISVAPTERFAVQQPRTVDQAGNPTTPSVNVPVSIATQIKNNTARAMDYVYIVQVKDANGVVVSISTVSSTLDAGRTANVSASWTPTAPGTYTIETFVWSELGKPSPLSPLQRITVTAT